MGIEFKPLKPESDHLLHLDCLRMIAASGIVISHYLGHIPNLNWHLDALKDRFSIFVDMFFVISGFVIAFIYFQEMINTQSYFYFLRKRLARLLPLHWLMLAIFACLGILISWRGIHVNHPDTFDWKCLISNLLLLNAMDTCPHLSFNGVSWSISAEFGMYVLTPLVFGLARRNPWLLLSVVVLSWTAFSLRESGGGWLGWTSNVGVLRAIPSFFLGAFLYVIRDKLAIPYASYLMWATLTGFIAGCLLGLPWLLLVCILYVATICAVGADVSGPSSKLVRLCAAGGQLTYSSYMVHEFISIVMISVLAKGVLHLGGWALIAAIAGTFMLVWPVSYLSLNLFERPLRRYLSPRRPQRAPGSLAATGFAPVAPE